MRTTVLVLGLLGCGINLLAGDSEQERQTLKGIKSVDVFVLDLSPDEMSDGLSVSQIKTDVELRLRLAGIKVDPTSSIRLYVAPNLVKVAATRIGNATLEAYYGYNIDVECDQPVIVVATGRLASGKTWSTSTVATVGRRAMSKEVRESIGGQVDRFINSYLSVNPK